MRSSRLHLGLAVVWVVLMVPTLTTWRDSLWWVGFISVYANIVSHLGAYEAARAKEKEGDDDD